MQQSYDYKLRQLEERRLRLLAEKKGELDDLGAMCEVSGSAQMQAQSVLKQDITNLLNRSEIIKFLLKAGPFLRKYEALQQLPQATSLESRRELHEEFLVAFNMEDVIPEEIQTRRKRERQALNQKYIARESRTCIGCGRTDVDMIHRNDTGLVCPHCGSSKGDSIVDGIDGLPYDEKIRVGSPPYTYKPEQHFTDLLNQVQGKTRRPIPAELLMQLRLECRKRGIPQNTITPQMMRKILREIRRTEYYDEICAIAHTLNREYKLVQITDEDQALLRALFREVYSHFHEAKARVNPSRKNFMSYPHLARVLCDLMNFTSYTKEFTSLKNREKQRNHDRLLQEIFDKCGWTYRKTV